MNRGATANEDAASDGPSTRVVAWVREWLIFDRSRFVYAMNIALITALTLFLGFLVNLQNTYWGLLAIPFVAQMNSGLTVWRSLMRVIGTVIGCLVGLAIVGFFAQDGLSAVAALSLWVLGVGFFARFEVGLDAYSYATAGLTALVIVFDTGPNADLAYGFALARTTETLIAVAAAFAVLLVVFPQSIAGTLQTGLLDARTRVLSIARAAATPGNASPIDDRQAATKALSGIYSNLRALKFERSHRAFPVTKVGAAANRLNYVLIDAEALAFVLMEFRGEVLPSRVAERIERLDALLGTIPANFAGTEAAVAAAIRFRAFVNETTTDAPVDAGASEASILETTALHAARRLGGTLAAFFEAEAAVFDPDRPAPREEPIASRYPDVLAALERGLRPALLFFALALLWIGTASSALGTVALISAAMTLNLPTLALRAMQAKGGLAIGLGIAAAFLPVLALEISLPYVETFPVYALLVSSFMFVLFYICSAPGLLTYAFGGVILLAVTLRPSNVQTYDALAVFNSAAVLAFLPVSIAAAFTIICRKARRGCCGTCVAGREDFSSARRGARTTTPTNSSPSRST